jgi:hypothetical protein
VTNRRFAFEVRLMEFIARHLWPLLRPIAARHLSRRCSRCILPAGCAPLNGDGVCSHCEGLATEPAPAESTADMSARRLDELLEEQQGRAEGPFDALLLFSGGKDSSYLLHRITTSYPRLRLLTVMVDNGFMSPYALDNAERVLRRFDVAHLRLQPRPSLVRRTFRCALTHLDRQDGYSIVDEMDGHITYDSAKLLAVRMEIPLILCGISTVQAEFALGFTGSEMPPELGLRQTLERLEIPADEVLADGDMHDWWDPQQHPAERLPRVLLPLVAWDVSEEEILSEVARLGLLDERRSSPLMTNNALIPVIAMAEVARFGYCCWEVEFARMIREGRSARGYWLNLFEMMEYAARTGRFVGSVDETLARLELSRQQVGIA